MLVLGSASVKESLFKKLIEWAKNKNNGMEKLICATQSNWINWHEDLALAKVKATISLIDLFLQLEENVKNEWIFQYMFKSCTTLEYPRSLALFLATGAGDLEFVLETVM